MRDKMTYRVPRLDKHRPWSGELADQTLSRRKARDDSARRNPLHHIFRVPRHQMAVVDNVLLSIRELSRCQYTA